jgi:hypothetical protein
MTTDTAPLRCDLVPVDLCEQAIKLARRVQALPRGKVYGIILVKQGDGCWSWSVDEGRKLEQP